MTLRPISDVAQRDGYDVIIVGGAVIGSSIAWFLADHLDFDGTVLVVERDMTYENCSTAHTNSCMRQQFSNPLNVQISRFAAEFVRDFRSYLGDDPEVPDLHVNHFGYLYLATDETFAETLRTSQAVQAELGAGTTTLSPAEIREAYPFYNVDDIVCGNHNLIDEGYFDSGTMFQWLRRKARESNVEYLRGDVTDIVRDADQVTAVTLVSGESIRCGTLVNAAGPRSVEVARMAGLHLPVEARKRFTFIFDAAEPLDRDLPLTIDPSGVHVRSDGAAYMTGCAPNDDAAVDFDDFAMDGDIFDEKVWPVLAHRIPAFERLKITSQWAGHYAYNTLDHNVVVGPHHEVANFIFANGFSGHGMQQSPAVGRGVAELISSGRFQSLDLTPVGYRRIVEREPFMETAMI